jgi:L-alanine-DL-glutamate epimerase-like enolase superfamily enzyme
MVPHGWNTAVGLAADLQLVSAFPKIDLVEYLTGSPFIDEIVKHRWRIDEEGMLTIPERPGLGITIDLEALKEFTGLKSFLD